MGRKSRSRPVPLRCGKCQACCVIPEIPELSKPAHKPCQHLGENGCTIYEDRPEPCRKFECLWLKEQMTRETRFRPNNLGMIAWMSETAVGNVLNFSFGQDPPDLEQMNVCNGIVGHSRYRAAMGEGPPVLVNGPGERRELTALPELLEAVRSIVK